MPKAQGHIIVRRRPKDGADGNGILSTIVEYGVSASQTEQPASWSETKPTLYQGSWLWTRTTIKYTDTTKADTVSYTVAYISKDGVSISIDTPSRTFIYNSDGTLLNGTFSTNIRLFNRSTEILPASVTWNAESSDDAYSAYKPTYGISYLGVLTVTDIKRNGYITVSATYDSVTYQVKFAYTREVREASYELSVSPLAVTYKDGTTPASVTVIVRKSIEIAGGGSQTTVLSSLPSGFTLYVNGSSVTYPGTSGYVFTPNTSLSKNVISLVKNGAEYRRVEVTVTKVADGEKGDPGDGISEIYIHYAVGTDNYNPPAYWSTDMPTTIPQGSWLWTRTTIVYTDTTKANKVSYTVAYQGVDGTGTAGLPGCIYRGPTMWEAGKEYRNDQESGETDEDGLRYIDVCTDVNIALVTDTYNAYVCRKTHVSDASTKPLAEGTYWSKMNSTKPIATTLILSQQILADYIDVNSLASNTAFINDLTAKHLQTVAIAPTTKAIVINKDDLGYIQVYNGTKERVRISGEAVGDISSLITTGSRGSGTKTGSFTPPSGIQPAYYDVVILSKTSNFTIAAGNAYALKDTTVNVSLPTLTTTEGVIPDWQAVTAIVELYTSSGTSLMTWSASAKDIKRGTNAYTASVCLSSATTYTNSSPAALTCYLKLTVRVTPAVSVSGTKTISATYSLADVQIVAVGQKIVIGNNGLYSIWGPNNYVFITGDNEIQMRSGGAGIEMKGGSLAITVDGVKYTASATSAKDADGNTIKVLKLTS